MRLIPRTSTSVASNEIITELSIAKCRMHLLLALTTTILYPLYLAELLKRRTKNILEDIQCIALEDMEQHDDFAITESEFWKQLISRKLKPISSKFTQIKDIHKSLQSLRNATLAMLLLVNLMWIVLLTSLTFWQLQKYNIDPRAFQLLFLAVYGFIIIVQFFTMLAHRGVTLVHYLGRVKPREVSVNAWRNYNDGFGIVSLRELDPMSS